MYITLLEVGMRKIGNEKHPNWKLVVRKFRISNWKINVEIDNGHGPSGPPYILPQLQDLQLHSFHLQRAQASYCLTGVILLA